MISTQSFRVQEGQGVVCCRGPPISCKKDSGSLTQVHPIVSGAHNLCSTLSTRWSAPSTLCSTPSTLCTSPTVSGLTIGFVQIPRGRGHTSHPFCRVAPFCWRPLSLRPTMPTGWTRWTPPILCLTFVRCLHPCYLPCLASVPTAQSATLSHSPPPPQPPGCKNTPTTTGWGFSAHTEELPADGGFYRCMHTVLNAQSCACDRSSVPKSVCLCCRISNSPK